MIVASCALVANSSNCAECLRKVYAQSAPDGTVPDAGVEC